MDTKLNNKLEDSTLESVSGGIFFLDSSNDSTGGAIIVTSPAGDAETSNTSDVCGSVNLGGICGTADNAAIDNCSKTDVSCEHLWICK